MDSIPPGRRVPRRPSRPGDVGLILGTTAVVNLVIDPEPFHGEPVGATLAHPFNERWIRVIAPLSGTFAFDWFASLLSQSFGGGSSPSWWPA